MNLREERNQTGLAIASGKFVKHVLVTTAKEIDKDIVKRMSSFDSSFWAFRSFDVTDNEIIYTTLKQHRFVDMKTRQNEGGVSNKKRHSIHNKPIYEHLNNLARELMYGFTDAVKSKFYNVEDTL
ncbi:hypothetical protein [Flavicella sp.]|uniref:hypothetical protein n=1 Tax=Flavicella sp. TaxID=2957742 RepID=UPI00301B2124